MLYNATNFLCNSLWSFLGAVPRKCCFGMSGLPLYFIYPLCATAFAHCACSWGTNSTGQAQGQLDNSGDSHEIWMQLPAHCLLLQHRRHLWLCGCVNRKGCSCHPSVQQGEHSPYLWHTTTTVMLEQLTVPYNAICSYLESVWSLDSAKDPSATVLCMQEIRGLDTAVHWVQREGPSSPWVSTTASKELRSWDFSSSVHLWGWCFSLKGTIRTSQFPQNVVS